MRRVYANIEQPRGDPLYAISRSDIYFDVDATARYAARRVRGRNVDAAIVATLHTREIPLFALFYRVIFDTPRIVRRAN